MPARLALFLKLCWIALCSALLDRGNRDAVDVHAEDDVPELAF